MKDPLAINADVADVIRMLKAKTASDVKLAPQPKGTLPWVATHNRVRVAVSQTTCERLVELGAKR